MALLLTTRHGCAGNEFICTALTGLFFRSVGDVQVDDLMLPPSSSLHFKGSCQLLGTWLRTIQMVVPLFLGDKDTNAVSTIEVSIR